MSDTPLTAEAPKPYQGTQITEPPAISGPAGQAWQARLAPLRERHAPDHDAGICVWIIRCPGAHPFWSHWALSLVHLRPLEGVKPAHKKFDAATHELMIFALNPEQPVPTLDIRKDWQLHYLTPFDVIEQFEASLDEIAAEIAELAVRAIVNGYASPDQDYRSWWARSIQQTAEHYRDGKHAARSR